MTESLEDPQPFYQVIFINPEQWDSKPGPFFASATKAKDYITSYKNHPSTRGSRVFCSLKTLYFEDERG